MARGNAFVSRSTACDSAELVTISLEDATMAH